MIDLTRIATNLLDKLITKKNIKYIIIVAIAAFFIFMLMNNRIKNQLIRSLGGYTHQETTIRIDTGEIVIDTTLIIDRWISTHAELLEPTIIKEDSIIYIPKYIEGDTIYIDSTTVRELYKYENPISDSLIDGIITTLIDFNNFEIVKQNLDYKPKFPIIITKTIPITKTITNTIENHRNIGIGADINTLGDYSIIGAYQNNKGWQFQGAYQINKSVPNNEIRVGIIKFF